MSDLSTGIVQDDEVLLRILVAPTHMKKGKKEPRASCLTEAETSGLSLLRKEQATDDQVRSVALQLVTRARSADRKHPESAGVFGVLEMHSGTIRSFKAASEAETAYCIYDTAEPDLECHVEAFQKVSGVDDALKDARRMGLFAQLGTNFVPVGSFRNGLLLDLAPAL